METLKKKRSIFHFKQFSVDDSDCAMKVGTDAVLLACSIPKNQKGKMLDIGSGSGLISLALAQNNTDAEITAVEVDRSAYLQSLNNFKNSKWACRLKALNSTIQAFANDSDLYFENILCNPPFFKNNAQLSGSRKIARQDTDLSFSDLIDSVDKLIAPMGTFHCIIPSERSEEIISLAKQCGLFPSSIINIKGKNNLAPKRRIISFTRNKNSEFKMKDIIVYNENNSYTKQYKENTKEFYLKF